MQCDVFMKFHRHENFYRLHWNIMDWKPNILLVSHKPVLCTAEDVKSLIQVHCNASSPYKFLTGFSLKQWRITLIHSLRTFTDSRNKHKTYSNYIIYLLSTLSTHNKRTCSIKITLLVVVKHFTRGREIFDNGRWSRPISKLSMKFVNSYSWNYRKHS